MKTKEEKQIAEQKRKAERAMAEYTDASVDPNLTDQEKAKLHTTAAIEFDKLRALESKIEKEAAEDKRKKAPIGKFAISDDLAKRYEDGHLKKLSPYFEEAAKYWAGITCEILAFNDHEDDIVVVFTAGHYGTRKEVILKG